MNQTLSANIARLQCDGAELVVLYLIAFFQVPLSEAFIEEVGRPFLPDLLLETRPFRQPILRLLSRTLLASQVVERTLTLYSAPVFSKNPALREELIRYGHARTWRFRPDIVAAAYAKTCLPRNTSLASGRFQKNVAVPRILEASALSGNANVFASDIESYLFFDNFQDTDIFCLELSFYLQSVSDRFFPTGDETPTPDFEDLAAYLLPYRLFRTFSNERDCRPLLREFATACSAPRALSPQMQTVQSYLADSLFLAGALCVWTGERELLGLFKEFARPFHSTQLDRLFVFFTCCLDGSFDKADKTASAPLRTMHEYPSGNDYVARFTHLGLPAMALGLLSRTRGEQPYTVLEKIQKRCKVLQRFRDVDVSEKLSGMLCEFGEYSYGRSTKDSLLPELDKNPQPTALPYLLRLADLCSRSQWSKEKVTQTLAETALERAEAALAAGYPLLAASIAGLVYSIPSCATRAESLLGQTSGLTPFHVVYPPKAIWRQMLESLEKAFPEPAKTEPAPLSPKPAKAKRVGWHLELEKASAAGPGVYSIVGLSFTLHTEQKNGSLGKGAKISPKKAAELADDTYPTDIEKTALAHLRKVIRGILYFPGSALNEEDAHKALEAIFGHPLVFLEYPRQSDSPDKPVEIVRTEASFTTKRMADGSLSVKPPPGKEYEYPLLSPLGDGRYAISFLGKAACKMLDLMHEAKVADKGFTIPVEHVAEASRILCTVAKTVPLSGEITAEGDTADLRHLPADATPHARIRLEGETMEVALRVQPNPDEPQRFEPGKGVSSSLGQKNGEPVVFARDLAAERSAAKPIRTKLQEAFPDARLDPYRWRFETLLESLEALETLHSFMPGLVLEWLDNSRRIQFSAPVQTDLSASRGKDYWLGMTGDVTLDSGKLLSVLDLLAKLPERTGAFIPLDENRYLRLSRTLLRRLEALQSAGTVRGGELRVNPAAIPMLDAAFHGPVPAGEAAEAATFTLPETLEEETARFRQAFAMEVPVPEDLQATLRPYQLDGFRWLSRLSRCGIGACLADDMGLGKTLQIIALLLSRASEGPSLVVAPASVCGNWIAEIRRFAPSLDPVLVLPGPSADLPSEGPSLVVVASYGLLVSREKQFAERTWNGVVLDEAQAIKNHLSKRAHAVKRLRGAFRVVATGTPVENRLSELWSLFDFLNPGMLLSHDAFLQRYTEEGLATEPLKRLVSPLILRRLKREVLSDLPEKTEITLPVELGDDERHAYEACRLHSLEKLEGGGKDAGGRIAILAELTRLRRFCCHPSLVVPSFCDSAKMEALLDLLSNLKENGHKALVFSQFTDYLALVREKIEAQGWTYQYLDGTVPTAERTRRVAAFQAGESDFFLISLKAGGMGLNLTAANYVILLDPWWNPAVENQAADRAHRIGQRSAVTVYRLIAQGTVEEKVLELHARKRHLAEDLLDGTGDAALSADELLSLLRVTP